MSKSADIHLYKVIGQAVVAVMMYIYIGKGYVTSKGI